MTTTKLSILGLAAAAALAVSSCSDADTTNTTVASDDTAVLVPNTGNTPVIAELNTQDEYIDLRSGQTMRIKESTAPSSGATASANPDMPSNTMSATSRTYVWENDKPLDYFYVNTRTKDTFEGATGRLVNGFVLYDPASKMYSLDELNYEKNGDGYKAKSADGSVKIKENSNELKVKDGDAKLKANDNEVKYKDDEVKYKSNGDETKIKTDDMKIKTKDGKTTVKPR